MMILVIYKKGRDRGYSSERMKDDVDELSFTSNLVRISSKIQLRELEQCFL
jgi:hypothetical protein